MAKANNNPAQPDAPDSVPMKPTEILPSEFAQIPLDFIIATPLMSLLEAYKASAMRTLDFVKAVAAQPPVEFTTKITRTPDSGGTPVTETLTIQAPLLSIVKVPAMRFDSMTVAFNYSISQVHKVDTGSTLNIGGQAGLSGPLAKFVNASFTGNYTRTRSTESTGSRSGNLDIRINVSEAELPAGLEKIINAMTDFAKSSVSTTDAPPPVNPPAPTP